MIIIHLTRAQRKKLRELHPGLNNVYFTRALRFQNNSPLAIRIRNDALKMGGKLLTQRDLFRYEKT